MNQHKHNNKKEITIKKNYIWIFGLTALAIGITLTKPDGIFGDRGRDISILLLFLLTFQSD